MRPIIDIAGQRFGKLVVVSRVIDNTKSGTIWVCLCDCGQEKIVAARHLKSGDTVSCGCFSAEATGKRSKTHGMSKSRSYSIWSGMKQRCENPRSPEFYLYGERGVSVCAEWKESFEAFLADMGEAPVGKTLDRRDVDLGYSPENCRWATIEEQNNNTRKNRFITVGEETLSYTQWSKRLGGNPNLVYLRIRSGWDPVKAATVAVNGRFRVKHK